MENPLTTSQEIEITMEELKQITEENTKERNVRERSPIRRINSLRSAYKLTTDEDDDLSHLFLTSAVVLEMDKKAYGDRRYMEGILEVCHLLPLILNFSG